MTRGCRGRRAYTSASKRVDGLRGAERFHALQCTAGICFFELTAQVGHLGSVHSFLRDAHESGGIDGQHSRLGVVHLSDDSGREQIEFAVRVVEVGIVEERNVDRGVGVCDGSPDRCDLVVLDVESGVAVEVDGILGEDFAIAW